MINIPAIAKQSNGLFREFRNKCTVKPPFQEYFSICHVYYVRLFLRFRIKAVCLCYTQSRTDALGSLCPLTWSVASLSHFVVWNLNTIIWNHTRLGSSILYKVWKCSSFSHFFLQLLFQILYVVYCCNNSNEHKQHRLIVSPHYWVIQIFFGAVL